MRKRVGCVNDMKKRLWLKVTRDEYELPLIVADTSEELERMLGLRKKSVIRQIYKARKSKRKCQYVVVDIDE